MSEERLGQCYYKSFLALSGAAEGTVLVHGRPRLTRAPFSRYGHAWLEIGDVVVDVSQDKRLVVRRGVYYGVGDIRAADNLVYSQQQAYELAAMSGHSGPWDGPEGIFPTTPPPSQSSPDVDPVERAVGQIQRLQATGGY